MGDLGVKPKYPQGDMVELHKAMGQGEGVSHGGGVAYTYALWSPHHMQVGDTINTCVSLQFTLISLKACMVVLGKKMPKVGNMWG